MGVPGISGVARSTLFAECFVEMRLAKEGPIFREDFVTGGKWGVAHAASNALPMKVTSIEREDALGVDVTLENGLPASRAL